MTTWIQETTPVSTWTEVNPNVQVLGYDFLMTENNEFLVQEDLGRLIIGSSVQDPTDWVEQIPN